MTPCDRYRTDLAAYLYGDLAPDEAGRLEEHMKACPGCREECRALQRTSLLLGEDVMFPREREVDWSAFAAATVQRARGFRPAAALEKAARAGWLRWLEPVRLTPAWAAAAAGLALVAGVAIGTYGVLSLRPQEPAPIVVAAAPEPAAIHLPGRMLANIEESSARSGARRYLADSRALLVSLLGSPIKCTKGETVDITEERARSLELLRRQRFIADNLETLPLSRAQDVCRDLEQLLLEIASLNDCARAEQILELRNLVEERKLLLRLELVQDEMKRSRTTDV